MEYHYPYEISDVFVNGPPQYQYQAQEPPNPNVYSQSSSGDMFSPNHGSAILSNGNPFLSEPLRNYTDDLQFDPGANYEDPVIVSAFADC